MELEKLKELKETLNMLLEFEFIDSIEVKIESSLKIIEKAINYTRCSLQLKDGETLNFQEWIEYSGYKPYGCYEYRKGNIIFKRDELKKIYRLYQKNL